MGAHLLLAALAFTAPAQGADSQRAFANAATEALVRRAMARHQVADTTVGDYQATFRTRLTFAFGRRRWARIPPLAAEEQTGLLRWQRPNDLQIEMIGRRSRARNPDMDLKSVFDSPWFVPRALGDSVRVAGADFPQEAALHPLAAGAPEWYAYDLTDSLTVTTPEGNAVHLYRVTVTPRKVGKGLTVGYLLLDGATGEVVRFSFRFVGTGIWVAPDGDTHEDSVDAAKGNKWIGRLLTLDADLEYSLQDRAHWMPYRQTIRATIEIPFVGDAEVPVSFTTSFDDYEINTGGRIAFRLPAVHSKAEADSLQGAIWDSIQGHRRSPERGDSVGRDSTDDEEWTGWKTHGRDIPGIMGEGGRYEVHLPPLDSLDHYPGWGDSLQLDLAEDDSKAQRDLEAEIAAMAEHLPDEFTGRRGGVFAVERAADLFRFNRVQGPSIGAGYKLPFFHVPFTTAQGSARFGFSDTRLYLRGSLMREAPSGRWTLTGYRDLTPDDPFFQPKAVGNSINALLTGHDEADYLLAQGISLTREASLGVGRDLTLGWRLEDESSVAREAHGTLARVVSSDPFAPNPPVTEGVFGAMTATLEGTNATSKWRFGADLLASREKATARVMGEWRQRVNRGKSGLTLTARAGMTSDDPLPQSAFRFGGEGTVRGLPYGVIDAQAFWAVQGDLGIGHGNVRPVLFADAGQAGPRRGFFGRAVMTGAGAGLSFFGGFMRLDLSVPVGPDGGDPRFDVVFSAPR